MLTIDIEWNTKIHKFFIDELADEMHHSSINPKTEEKSTEIELRWKKIPHFTDFIEENLLEDITDYIIIGDDRRTTNEKISNIRIKVHKDIVDIIKNCPYDMYVNYGYRPLGMTCAGDTHGKLDATDIRGHWTGLALDLSMNENDKDVFNYLYDNNFSRPWINVKIDGKEKNEWWHFRYDGRIEKVDYNV